MPETASYPKFYLYNRIVRAKLFIDENYGQNIDLKNISEEAFFSKFHFIRLFKSIYGKTPHQYLISVRLRNAASLLERGHSITESCETVGFESVSTFKGLFRRSFGKSPGEYQRLYKQRQERIKQKPLSFIPNCFASSYGWI